MTCELCHQEPANCTCTESDRAFADLTDQLKALQHLPAVAAAQFTPPDFVQLDDGTMIRTATIQTVEVESFHDIHRLIIIIALENELRVINRDYASSKDRSTALSSLTAALLPPVPVSP